MPSLSYLVPTLFVSLALAAKIPETVLAAAPVAAGKANTFAVVGETGVSAQQLFLGVSRTELIRVPC